jgi:serine/threonine protein kinase
MVADQLIAALEFVHLKSFLHRDVKPDNFLIGTGNRSNQLFVIDFGLSKKYQNPETREHIKFAQGKSLTGTARYASVNALCGLEQSRRDDLEAIGYCLLYFLRGSLPWMGLDAKNHQEKYERICEVKMQISFERLCEGFPPEFVMYFKAVRALQFMERPNYALYRHWFRELFLRSGFVFDYLYDWVTGAEVGTDPQPLAPLKTSTEAANFGSSSRSREQQSPPLVEQPTRHELKRRGAPAKAAALGHRGGFCPPGRSEFPRGTPK